MFGRRTFALIAAAAVVCVISISIAAASAGGPPVRTVVVFDDAVSQPALQNIEKLGGVLTKSLPLVHGAVVYLPSTAAARAVANLQGVAYVEPDVQVEASGKGGKGGPNPPPPSPSQVLPWGIDRINAEIARQTTTGDPVKVAIVDTGIDTSHADLAANVKGGMSAVNYTRRYTDDNGHGTHVAGIVGALDNSIGVVGVGPSIDLYSVKVLNSSGSGWVSDIIEGLGWCQSNGIQVVNMSLGASAYSQAFHDAVSSLYGDGTVIVAAAGNGGNGSAVSYPAAFDEVIAVGATTSSDALASYSSTGAQVDLSAPGSAVYSTYKGNSYATLSGTSMASPHVAGVAALVLTRPVGSSDSDGDGVWDPAEVRARLIGTAEDLGPAGWDSGFGYGLVRADLAVAP